MKLLLAVKMCVKTGSAGQKIDISYQWRKRYWRGYEPEAV